MDEKEIIKECFILSENQHHELGDCWDEEYSSNAIKGLLRLYQLEKSKNDRTIHELEAEYSDVTSEYKDMLVYFANDFELNKELNEGIDIFKMEIPYTNSLKRDIELLDKLRFELENENIKILKKEKK